jgi:hypothetical protein
MEIMTNKVNGEAKLKSFIAHRTNQATVGRLVEGSEDSRSSFYDKARTELVDFVNKNGVNPYTVIGQPYQNVNIHDANSFNPVRDSAKKVQMSAQRMANTDFSGSLDDILAVIENDKLEAILGAKKVQEDVIAHADEKDARVFATYVDFVNQREFMKMYEATGKVKDEKELARVYKAAAKGIGKVNAEKFKRAGYTNLIESAELFALEGIKSGAYSEADIKKYALEGFKAELAEAEKELKDAETETKRSRYDLVRDSLRRFAGNTDDKVAEEARSAVYSAYKAK